MIGHMILNKYIKGEVGPTFSAAILGLKVGGGQILESGKTGALIEKVKKGSIADTVGHLRPGKRAFRTSTFLFLFVLFFFCDCMQTKKMVHRKEMDVTLSFCFLIDWIGAYFLFPHNYPRLSD